MTTLTMPKPAATLEDVAPLFKAAYAARRYKEARKLLEHMVALDPAQPALKFALAQLIYKNFRQTDEPIALLEDIIDSYPDRAAIHEFLSSIHLHLGDAETSIEHARAGIALDPSQAVCFQNMLRLKPALGAELAPLLRAALARAETPAKRLPFLHASLGKIYDDVGEYDQAFHHFTQANQLRRSEFNLDNPEFLLNEARAFFDRAFFESRRGYGLRDERPVFIVGLPRSGSTLLEQVISAHPQASTAGERHDLALANAALAENHHQLFGADKGGFRHLQHLTASESRKAARGYLGRVEAFVEDPSASRWIDKMPGNFAQIGLIQLLFPDARILHTRRSLLDVALSCYMQVFEEAHPYAEDPMIFAHFAIIYRQFMQHWDDLFGDRIRTVDYEDLARDLPGQAPGIIEHVGLGWSEACARPHENRGLVTTASAAQVRSPVYTTSIGRWKYYAKHLQPLIDVLARYEDLETQAVAEASAA